LVCIEEVYNLALSNKTKTNKMKTINQLNETLTSLEIEMLSKIIESYDFDSNICYQKSLTSTEKGIVGSLVKKGLVYDSFESEEGQGYESNFFPSDLVLDIYGLQHY
jgi:hypothetical protein